jgi:O-antigen ligase
MNSLRPWQWAGIALGSAVVLHFFYTHSWYLTSVSFLGGIIGLEILVALLWKFEQRFFAALVITFLLAGMYVPFSGVGKSGRWVLLFAGALIGFFVWQRAPRAPFRAIHLVALFCICAAFASATVSPFAQVAALKSLSLLLLFLYCATGARLAIIGREAKFFRGLILGCEIALYATAIGHFILGANVWGNPNSLGAAMSVGVFPVLLWAWSTSDTRKLKLRRLLAVLLCAYLVRVSMTRAGMASAAVVTIMFFVVLRQYKLMMKGVALVLFLVAIGGILAPVSLSNQIGDLKDAILYKGHKDEGLLGSRKEPWDQSIASIREHPFFGTGYGTSATAEDAGSGFGTFISTVGSREHGSSYIAIVEWQGLLGVWPFAALLAMILFNVWKVCVWMRRTSDPRDYSVPLAMVVVSGLVLGIFEDSLFAVGSYICLYFWIFAFLLADYVPRSIQLPVASVARTSSRSPVALEPAVSNR